ncbi:hypothetical protein S40288_11740 [Stachybotrys chartarum IBT 40288]|nr:hypothetical protein S40288_11740 [Stachybotrys chartarum IBT 40288]
MEDTIFVGGVNNADTELFIRTDHYQQERDDDITGRPDFDPIEEKGCDFILMGVPVCPVCLKPLPIIQMRLLSPPEVQDEALAAIPHGITMGRSGYNTIQAYTGVSRDYTEGGAPLCNVWVGFQLLKDTG